jgi:iron(III) transport system ATP-binding protein
VIEFRDICVRYGDFTAIDGLNLSVNKGEFFTFLGPSGCGKTTILRALVGFISPAGGVIEVNGKDITGVPVEKRKIGIVFQSYALFPSMNVFENIAFGMRVIKLDKQTITEKVRAVAKKTELNDSQLLRNVSELSGGQQQRVALARAMVMEPEILCLDEPLSNLDARLRVGLRGELKRLQRDLGITTLYVTHDQEEALTLSDRIAVFKRGKIEQVGTPDEIYNHSTTEFVCDFIGDINRLPPGLVERAAVRSGKKIENGRQGFIRVERLSITPSPRCGVSFSGTVTDREYYGLYINFEKMGHYVSISKVKSKMIKIKISNPMVNCLAHGTAYFLFLIYSIPIALVILFSFSNSLSILAGTLKAGDLTLVNYVEFFMSPNAFRPFMVSVSYSACAAVLVAVLVTVVSRILHKGDSRLSPLFEYGMLIPLPCPWGRLLKQPVKKPPALTLLPCPLSTRYCLWRFRRLHFFLYMGKLPKVTVPGLNAYRVQLFRTRRPANVSTSRQMGDTLMASMKHDSGLFFVLALSFYYGSCAGVPSGEPCDIPGDFAGLIHTGYSDDLDTEYALLEEMGVVWVHRDFSWSGIEPADGDWRYEDFDRYVSRANIEGKKILGMLLYDVGWIHDGTYADDRFNDGRSHDYVSASEIPLYCDYVRETVQRYNGNHGYGTVDAWAIWNEPNLKQFWQGTKEEFFALTREAVRTIRELDEAEGTTTTVIGGVLSDMELVFGNTSWVKGLFESRAMDGTDGIAFHPYHMSAQATGRIFNRFKGLVSPYGFADKIWVNEVGFPTRGLSPTKVAESRMSETVAKTITLLAAGGARNFFWYQIFDGDSFGLVDRSTLPWRKKGGYWAYVLCANNLAGKVFRTGAYQNLTAPSKTRNFYFEGDNGSRVLIVWNESGLFRKTISVNLPGVNHKRWNLVTGTSESINVSNGAYTATLYASGGKDPLTKPSLLFLTWNE